MALTISGFTMTGNLTAVHIPPPPPPIYYLWSFGRNYFGQLGLGNTTNVASPTQVGALTTWLNIAAGYHGLSTKTDNTMWTWGRNSYGQLGLGNSGTNVSSPVQVGALTTWSSVYAGSYSSLAIKTNGTLWSWGQNSYGRLGLGNTTDYSSPKQVGALTTWASISAGSGYWTAAIKTDGTLWSWGRPSFGVLGLGNTTAYSSPKQVGTLTTWLRVSGGSYHSIALKTDGTLWTWGRNAYGNLGIGNTTDYSSPKQVGAGTTWASIAGGSAHNIAIKTDGTMWSWGDNSNTGAGRLGLGDQERRSSPVQIGALTNWLKISAGRYHNLAIKTNGTLWSWGRNAYGEVGNGTTTTPVVSPIQVGSLTNWSSVAAGQRWSLAISS
jgi:alpha-tubulin suppressor-like RCC1 family protein